MKDKWEEIVQIYVDVFTLAKLKSDLFDYLNEDPCNCIDKNGDVFLLETYNTDTEKLHSIQINDQDKITIISYVSKYKYKELHFEIVIGIGNYTAIGKEFSDIFLIEKSFARMKYNHDLSLYDIEFYMTERNRPKDGTTYD